VPKYVKDINKEITEADAQEMINNCTNQQEKTLIAILYLTGARPIEVVALRVGDINPGANPDYFTIKLKTAKLRKGVYQGSVERTLLIPKDSPFAQMLIKEVLNVINPEAKLFGFNTPDNVKQIVYKVSNNKWCPYHFRHSRLNKLARQGMGVSELMSWKGARDVQSVSAYLRGKPQGRVFKLD
jgi:integrase